MTTDYCLTATHNA